MKSFNGISVRSQNSSDGDIYLNIKTPEKYSEVDMPASEKKRRLMSEMNDSIKTDVDTSSHESSDSENLLNHHNVSNEKSMDNGDDDDDNDNAEEDEEFSEYELLQKKNIEERNEFLRTLGIKGAMNDFVSLATRTKKVPKTTKKYTPVRRSRQEEILPKREPSRRLRDRAAAMTGTKENFETGLFQDDTSDKQVKEEFVKEEVDSRLKGTLTLELDEEELNLLKSFPLLDENCTYDPTVDLKSCSIESFRSNIACLKMIGPHKVTPKRVQSICVHPSITKQIILVGSAAGSLGLWDINAGVENDVVELSYHKAALNCVTVSTFNHCKIFTTSHEGSVCTVDIEHKKCTNVFSTDPTYRTKHLTWHEEMDPNTLLISHGDGSVGILDLREDAANKVSWIDCFDRSCRTVQLHPMNSNYFLASSGTVGCKIFDLRTCPKSVCVSDLPHPKGLTSAFFSPNGNSILTTCNDDRLRIFDSSSFVENLPKQKRAFTHNNHTGRWLSVFKASWFPYRSDAFFVGSLLSPRRIQIFEDTGSILLELHHEDMLTISPVIGVHPKLPLIAGGNSSGRIHAFVPPKSEETCV